MNKLAAGILSVIILIYHYMQILVFCRPAEKAVVLVQSIAMPMTLSNAGGVVIFLYTFRGAQDQKKGTNISRQKKE